MHRSVYESYCSFTWRLARTLKRGELLCYGMWQRMDGMHRRVVSQTKQLIEGQALLRHVFPDDHGVGMVVCYAYMAVAAAAMPLVMRVVQLCWS